MTGKELNKMSIPFSEPHLCGNEKKYVTDCLDTGWVSSVGGYVNSFERKVADRVTRKCAVACVSGTAALHIAQIVAGVQPGDEVIMPALTFAAPAFATRYIGAFPAFLDVDEKYWQLDPQRLKEFLTKDCVFRKGVLKNKHTGRRLLAIVAVHLLGHPADMGPIIRLAREYGLKVIEDAAESIGAQYRNKPVGALGDIACFSFNGSKIVTCGGGGMLVTDNKKWADRARYLTTQAKDDPVEYIHNEVGYNYRLTNVQAAIGLAQMEQLDCFIEKKRRIAQGYEKRLKSIKGIKLPEEASWARSTFWLYTVRVNRSRFGMDSRELMRHLGREGIQSRPLWHPLHSLPVFKECFAGPISIADSLYRTALSLPSSVGLTSQSLHRITACLRNKTICGVI